MASSSSNTSGQSPLRLKLVIVGGGIAGLATAFTLQKAGHSVIVLEKWDEKTTSLGEMSGAIRAPPNMTRLLCRWGLGPALNEKSIKCERLVYVNGNSGGLLGMILNDEFLQDPLTDMMVLVQHADLLNMLRDLALQEGVEIRKNANVVQVETDPVSVQLESGDIISGDIIVLADGCSSKLQSSVAGHPPPIQDPPLEAAPRVLFVAFTVDINLLKDDESYRGVLEPINWVTWMAEDTIVRTCVVNGVVVGSLSREYYGVLTEEDEDWSYERDLESYGLDLSALEARFRKILQLSKTIVSRTFLKRSMPEELVNEASSVVLVGEAAHPLMCEGMHSTALVIEDAETLGTLLSKVESRAQVSQLIMAYEDIRLPRCVRMYKDHWHLDSILKYPIGVQQESRDRVLRRTLVYEDWDMLEASGFQAALGDHLASFAYDATEAVEDWRASRVKHKPLWRAPLQVWVTQE